MTPASSFNAEHPPHDLLCGPCSSGLLGGCRFGKGPKCHRTYVNLVWCEDVKIPEVRTQNPAVCTPPQRLCRPTGRRRRSPTFLRETPPRDLRSLPRHRPIAAEDHCLREDVEMHISWSNSILPVSLKFIFLNFLLLARL